MGEGFLFSFKGNKEMTRQHEHVCNRCDYSYRPQELNEWLPDIQKLDRVAGKTFIFANNHFRGQGVSTISPLPMMLD